ncbi:endonuclease domain-containing protein [Thalassospiraceae bacterium LMO-SO8]|nr:endonuclease domain-containing protein [Alphaproteobacteria bacterium LMO-S08]WND75872.1 endonuclease domain-containing protein [Thalassospiraceae bacterium LMO-SO8]
MTTLLRKSMTDAERRLWQALRNRQLASHKFRRQHPIPPYVADFACVERGLIVEVDGGQHSARAEADAARTQALQARGFRVLRIWNNEVMENLEGVLAAILAVLED